MKIFIRLHECVLLSSLCVVHSQEASDHEEVEDADGEEEEEDVAAEEMSDESDSEELEEKGSSDCVQFC